MRIYLIDNELIVTKTLQGFLKDLGHDVVPFNSIAEFLNNRIKVNGGNGGIDVIIVDLNMPKQDGIRLINEIHRKCPHSDIIVMSCILPFHEAITHSVYSYLKKPIYFDELELVLARLSERHNENHNENNEGVSKYMDYVNGKNE
ncbi:MAG: response regulator [bacterium]